MQRDLQRLADETFDVLVIGGGIHGLAMAWDAALRGLAVALVEKSDFAAATSANSLKTIHGGLRYLQHFDLPRMRDSIRERSAWMRIVPHLVDPLPFLVPTYGYGIESKWLMAIAVRVNDWISRHRNEMLVGVGHNIPDSRNLRCNECIDLAPWLQTKSLTGGVQFFDGQLYSSERAAMAFAHAASERGAVLANYVAAVRLVCEGVRCKGAIVRDRVSEQEFRVSARVVINAAGPWMDRVLDLAQTDQPCRPVLLSKGVQLVMRAFTSNSAVAIRSTHQDPDAVVNRGARHYFLTPWRGTTLCGTTDELFEGHPDEFEITEADRDNFLIELQQAIPGAGLGRDMILHAFGGLRPLDGRKVGSGSQTASCHRVVDHRRDLGIDGLISVVGVKYTTARLVAEQAINVATQLLGSRAPCRTLTTPLWGGDTGQVSTFLAKMTDSLSTLVGRDVAEHLARSYGTKANELRPYLEQGGSAILTIPGREQVVQAQIRYAVREECAVFVEDVLRRTDLSAFGCPGSAALAVCLDVMRDECGWDDRRYETEVARLSMSVGGDGVVKEL